MSAATDEILEKLKTLSLLEALNWFLKSKKLLA